MAAVVPAKEPAINLENGGRVLERAAEIASLKFNSFQKTSALVSRSHSLVLKAVAGSQQLLVLLVGTELNGGVRDDPHHGGGVAPPQAEEAILQVGAVDQLVGLLQHQHTHV